jgi:hypothetical protein
MGRTVAVLVRVRGVVRGLVPVLVVVLGAGFAACGGDDETSAADPTAAFIADADATCTELNSQAEEFNDFQTLSELAGNVREALPIIDDGLARLEAIEPPDDLASEYDDFLATVEDQADLIERIGEAAADGDLSEVQRLAAEVQEIDRRQRDIAASIGFNECGTA